MNELDELVEQVTQKVVKYGEGRYEILVSGDLVYDDRDYAVTVDLINERETGPNEYELIQWHGVDFQVDSAPERVDSYTLKEALAGWGVEFEGDSR
ncbi:hypothetical protein ACOZ35_03300 [Halorubrum xinjiangense]|uniref:hypothetical protein n=1 Tax=Halorubrum xinjiangense TaxID=261291 RepID=UPI003C704482